MIKLGVNLIKDVTGIRALEHLKLLKLMDNPLNDCTELNFMSRKHFKLLYSEPGKGKDAEHQPTQNFYQRYNTII